MALDEVSTADVVRTFTPLPSARLDPDGFDVLVLDAATRQSLAVARSLGRAGLRVATGDCDPDLPALACHSRYSAHSEVLPSFATHPREFAAAVLNFVRRHPTRAVIPAGDGSIAALQPSRPHLEALGCRLALPSDSALEFGNDKGRSLQAARSLGIACPVTRTIESVGAVGSVLGEIGFPAVLKPTRSWAPRSVARLQAVVVLDEAEGVDAVRRFLRAGAGVLAQRWVNGRREGVTLFVQNGEVLASFAHLEHRTIPALGGASVLRESLRMPPDIYAASVRLVTALGIEGLSEVEFRRDRDGVPLLMEINARLAGPIETAVHAGVDFPLMLWQWAVGLPVDRSDSFRPGVRMRWLHGDLRWVRDNFREAGRPDTVSRTRALAQFAAEFLRAPHYDCGDWRDPRPVFTELYHTVSAIRRSFTTQRASAPRYPVKGGHNGS